MRIGVGFSNFLCLTTYRLSLFFLWFSILLTWSNYSSIISIPLLLTLNSSNSLPFSSKSQDSDTVSRKSHSNLILGIFEQKKIRRRNVYLNGRKIERRKVYLNGLKIERWNVNLNGKNIKRNNLYLNGKMFKMKNVYFNGKRSKERTYIWMIKRSKEMTYIWMIKRSKEKIHIWMLFRNNVNLKRTKDRIF